MKFIFDKDSWQEIFGSIKKNKLRTVITVIGVLWGIFLFIFLLGLARGMENGFDREFKNLATNSIFLWAQRTEMPNKGFQRGRRLRLKVQDAEAIKKQVPEVEFVVPRNVQGVFGGAPAQIKRKTDAKTYKLFGDYPNLDNVNKVKLLDGRFLNNTDINESRKVCIIGEKIIDELFEKDEKPVGDFLEINGSFFQIVGTYKDNGTSFEGDDSVYIPFSTYRKINNMGDFIGWMVIAANKQADIERIEDEVKSILKRRHNVHPDDKRAFGAFNFGEMFGKIMGFITGMKFLTWFVGISTLIAGVIAIGSILLITVKERTKEIGIRRAIGATPGKIRSQIVLESVFLTLLAGILGIILAGGFLMATNALFTEGDGIPFVNPTVNITIALGSVIALVSFGTLIGMVPAQIAVVIRPIEALREE
ncbi:MAG: FtsX-like permease family protein [Flavobacteriaceae bacterium]|nr:MAG: FtsX-like permease family protein [Flavobacteriaceae bacterium]